MKSVLHILAQRIIVGTEGEITAYGLKSLFVHLRWFTQDLSTPGSGKGGSEHVPLGASIAQKPPTHDVERFLSMLRFDSRGKVKALGRYVELEASNTGI